ncbi:glycerophosphodiester phosphodiesterase family protein [Thalassobaculum sp. OXR-137]|uniref:glycerophosphodiester phosphodiesterase n=1 Tax=Thalassobaculum sp. OXR-137 TaxID=3100173 RepID=UPI002AC92FF1|nr:glycerophosphodiester phosphodiesterase family protein [Thalassobaculum sp. OXR-137]WPZ34013.1 glycerophosphodiester phosphodiesterase family protein [Thalassobaculum sp. OXR-137]
MTRRLPQIIAHRGDSANAPENSLAALDSAIAAGADRVECDVRIAGDGTLVVSHDADLSRIAGRPVLIDDTPAEELARIAAAAGASVLPLATLFEAARGRIPLMLDVKSLIPAVLEKIAADLAKTGFDPRQIALGLRDPALVGPARLVLPTARVLALNGGTTPVETFLAEEVELIRLWERDADAETVAALHRQGCTVWVTTGGAGTERDVGDCGADHLFRLIAAGADGLLVNDPALGRRAVLSAA